MYENDSGRPYGAFAPQRSAPDFAAAEKGLQRLLFLIGNLVGLGLLGYLLLSFGFSMILGKSRAVYDLYQNVPLDGYLMDILYSLLCVGGPFLLVYCLIRRLPPYRDLTIPLGRTYDVRSTRLLIPVGIALCFAGSIATNYFAFYADSVGIGFYSYYEALEPDALPEGVIGAVVLLLRSALIPALVEEFAFRGVVVQTLRKYGDWFAIISSAVLFGMMHANMTQVPFAVIAGIALGYCAVVTGSLRTSIIVHCCNNLVSVVVAVVADRAGEGPAGIASSVLLYGMIAVGIIALVLYISKNPNFLRLYPGQFGFIRKKNRRFFLAPVLLIAMGWLLWYTVTDIVPFAEFLGRGR